MLAVTAVAGTVVLLVVTRRGAYLSPDSLAYVGTARNLLDGRGLTPPPGSPPLGNFAPLYALVLAAGGLLGPDPLTVAGWVSPVALGGTILAVGLLARRLSGSLPLAVGAQLLVLAGTDFLRYGSAALSEPLFLLLAFSTVAGLWRCLDRRGAAPLVAAGALAAATCLTRYVGVAVVAAGVVAFVRRGRWRDAALFAAVAVAPLAAWFGWLRLAEGRASNRTAVLHLPGLSYLTGGLRPWLVLLVVVAVLLPRARARSHAAAHAAAHEGALLVCLFAGFYLAALVADRLLFDVTGRLDARFLLAVHVSVILLAAWALGAVTLPRGAQAAVAAFVAVTVASGAAWAARDSLGGFGAPEWATSRVMDRVRALPPGAPVYSNQPDAVWFHAARAALPVPEQRALLTGRPNPAYGAELAAMAAGLDRGGVLVYFTRGPARRVFLPTAGDLAARLGLSEVARDATGVAYVRT